MKSFANKVAVVTGAGSGLGQSLAVQLHQAGAHLALCDLNAAGLHATGKLLTNQTTRVSLHQLDVASPSKMSSFAQAVMDKYQQVDILINNAGITLTPTPFDDIGEEQFRQVIQVNMWGVYHGIKEFLPHLHTRSEASIVTVSSLAGLVGLTGYSPYAMSKSAIRGLSECLQMELVGTPIHVLVVYPGGIKTNLIRNAPNLPAAQREAAHRTFTQTAFLTSEAAAGKILKAIRQRRGRLILGIDAKLVYAIRTLFPRRYPFILHAIFNRMTFR